MLPEDIDDLFREQLGGHASPPGEDLWARLQAQVPPATSASPKADASAERLDQLFRQGLKGHASPPRRELWERLEDEHLRPRKRRAAAWWPMAMAAAVALLLLVGGAGWWLGFPNANTTTGTVASQASPTGPAIKAEPSLITETDKAHAGAPPQQVAGAAGGAKAISEPRSAEPVPRNLTSKATRSPVAASTASKASKAAREQSFRHLNRATRQLDAAAGIPQQVAGTTPPPATRQAPLPGADEPRKPLETTTAIAQVTKPVPATPATETFPTTASELITVDVRTGDAAGRPAKAEVSALASAEAPEGRRGLGGRLLQQAGHLVRGERVSISEVTGLPETVTLHATLAGRHLTKSIQL